jgi:hypothetical protein
LYQHCKYIERDDLKWALGILTSRGYGGDAKPSLIPFIDLINHRCEALPFLRQLLEVHSDSADSAAAESESAALSSAEEEVASFFTVWASWGGEPRALEVGEEVYVDYLMGGMSASEAFISHGFIPPEKLDKVCNTDR